MGVVLTRKINLALEKQGNDAVQRYYYGNMGTEGIVEEEDYRNRYSKEAIVRRAIRLAKCTPAIEPFKTNEPGEMALFASFTSHNPQYIHRRLPASQIPGGFVPEQRN